MNEGLPFGAADELLSTARRRKRRRQFVLLSLMSGTALGLASVLTLGWFWMRSYLESPRFWQDLSAAASFDLSAKAARVELFPPALFVERLEIKKGNERIGDIDRIEARMPFGALLMLKPELRLEIDGMRLREWGSAQDARSSLKTAQNSIHVPRAANAPVNLSFSGLSLLRSFRIAAHAMRIALPLEYLPPTDASLELELEARENSKLGIRLGALRVFGLSLKGLAELDSRLAGDFSLELPEKESLVSGMIFGTLGGSLAALRSKGNLKFPGTVVAIPKNATWLAAGKTASFAGEARFGGGVRFTLDGRPGGTLGWSADSTLDVDLTNATVQYGAYTKARGVSATASGQFKGEPGSWKLSQVKAVVGQAHVAFELEQLAGQGLRVQASAPAFEIAEFVPFFLKENAPKQALLGDSRVSGKLAAEVNLAISPQGEPTGSVNAELKDWMLAGEMAARLAAVPGMTASGLLEAHGKVSAQIDRGVFREGSARLITDLSALELAFGEHFRKAVGAPLVLDIAADGSGKSILFKSLRLQGAGGLKIQARGSVADLKDYSTKLVFADTRIPLKSLAELVPVASGGTGAIELGGEAQGSLKGDAGFFAKLKCGLRKVGFAGKEVELKHFTGEIEATVSGVRKPETSEGDDSVEPGLGVIARMTAVRGEISLKPQALVATAAPLELDAQGEVGFKNGALNGDMAFKLSPLEATPWLAVFRSQPSTANESVAVVPKTATTPPEFPIDLKRSRFKLRIETPRLQTEYLELSDAAAEFTVGRAGQASLASAPDITIERVMGSAMEGSLSLSGKMRLSATEKNEFTVSATDVSMERLAKTAQKISGKAFEGQVFGRGTLDLVGSSAGSLATSELTGSFEIREGGFRFLPVPRNLLERMKSIPELGEKLGLDQESGTLADRLEKAKARFHLKGDRIDLDVEGADPRMGLSATGFVTLSGHCDLAGKLTPKPGLLPAIAAMQAINEVPFTSVGDAWACGFKPELTKLASQLVTHLAKEKLEQKVQEQKSRLLEKARDDVGQKIQNSLKGLFGK